jgi:hypothetical protein
MVDLRPPPPSSGWRQLERRPGALPTVARGIEQRSRNKAGAVRGGPALKYGASWCGISRWAVPKMGVVGIRVGSIGKPADQAAPYNSSEEDRPQPEKQARGSERHWVCSPSPRRTTPTAPSAAWGGTPYDSLRMPARNQRYVDISAVS